MAGKPKHAQKAFKPKRAPVAVPSLSESEATPTLTKSPSPMDSFWRPGPFAALVVSVLLAHWALNFLTSPSSSFSSFLFSSSTAHPASRSDLQSPQSQEAQSELAEAASSPLLGPEWRQVTTPAPVVIANAAWTAKTEVPKFLQRATVIKSHPSVAEWIKNKLFSKSWYSDIFRKYGVQVNIPTKVDTSAHTIFAISMRNVTSNRDGLTRVLPFKVPQQPKSTRDRLQWGVPTRVRTKDIKEVFNYVPDGNKEWLSTSFNLFGESVNDLFMLDFLTGLHTLKLPLLKEVRLWISHEGSSCTAHYDQSESLVIQLEGDKEWEVWSPEQAPNFYPRVSPHHRQAIEYPLLVLNWSSLVDGSAPTHTFVLRPGHVLYLPAYWTHRVRCARGLCRSLNLWAEPERMFPSGRQLTTKVGEYLKSDFPASAGVWLQATLHLIAAAGLSPPECFLDHLWFTRYAPLYPRSTFLSHCDPVGSLDLTAAWSINAYAEEAKIAAQVRGPGTLEIEIGSTVELFLTEAAGVDPANIPRLLACWARPAQGARCAGDAWQTPPEALPIVR
eukprot:gb/GEZN01004883.1/.p1 GENE.gb/GEZN01004883.1/~~gb/GEZN01004883.1/.p1  ORF type:complete len:592 (+),score=52.43 gb/GEZN01004883.1/:108-1778(+)